MLGAKCLNQVNTGGENISLTYSPNGQYVAVGTKVGSYALASKSALGRLIFS